MSSESEYYAEGLVPSILRWFKETGAGNWPTFHMQLDGGLPDEYRLLPVARLVGPSDMMLGSATVINKDWALAVSHCLSSDPEDLQLYTISGKRDDVPVYNRVDTVHWQDGFCARVGDNCWHPRASEFTGLRDQIVLLHLAEPMDEFNLDYAQLPGEACPEADDHVLVAGYGEDRDGNYPTYPQMAFARYLEPRTQWRGAIYRDRHVLLNGMVRKYDSGAPLFLPDFSILKHWTRLLGLHTTRSDMNARRSGMSEEGIATFLPLSPAVQAWIYKASGMAPPPLDVKVSEEFVLRNAHNCLRVRSDDALCNEIDSLGRRAAWALNSVASANGIFKKCERVEIYEAKDRLPYMRFVDRSGLRGQPILLNRDPTDHWFYGIDANRTEFYVFARPDGSTFQDVVCRRIRIEAFVAGSERIRPGPHNIQDAKKLNLDTREKVICDGTLSPDGAPVARGAENPDQDDQTNGYEKPR
ncbi:trypsin-like serine protease [Tahibacter soli]|uniref:Trypsin-like serine protease n=1 Tax=Tahibacter soli TaxID=2983605 RepID=A0A9X3YPC6_9GAMM|nr:trypsin-like serine protease [Tahibacter soli]MDC8015392.1 trypsin-like serine protease [Tahibacter soli]